MPNLGALLLGSSLIAVPAFADTLKGEAVSVGNGTAQTIVETDASGAPISVGISLTDSALEGLPTGVNPASGMPEWDFVLPMPAGVDTGYDHAVIDWNPEGHPPPNVYTVPHFDFHFYTIPEADVHAIKFSGPDDPAIEVSDTGLIPKDYQVIPDTAVPMMGVHAIDMTAPELHGTPFTATFIYGYNMGNLIFVEPMVTMELLKSGQDMSMPVKTPAHYSSAGYYPTSYGIQHDTAAKSFMVSLDGLSAAK